MLSLGLEGSLLFRSRGGLLLGGDGEIGGPILLVGGRGHAGIGRATADDLLGLGGVVTHVLLGELGSVGGVLLGDGPQLGGLGVDDVARLLQVAVDELLVGGVDERSEEDDGGGDQGEAPVRDNLDQEVGEEGTKESLLRQLAFDA